MADGRIDIDTEIDGDAAEQGLQDLQSKLEATGKKMSAIGKGMSAGVTAPIVAVGGAALKTASDFESAQGKMQAQLGLTAEETEKYGQTARDMWKRGFGENIGEVTDAIATVKQNIGDLNDADLQKVTEGAFTIQEAFGEDITASTATASVMMKNFGIDATGAMDLMTVGMQKGGNFSGELLDTMREYSPMFSGMGHSAEDMMNILISGAEAGAWNMDKVGDAVKEFNIRAKDGSKATAEGFAAIGMDATEMGAAIAEGGEKGEQAFQATLAGLAAMEDPVARNTAGVSLFGTQWEDLESDVMAAMVNGVNHVEGFEGATARAGDSLRDTFGTRLKELWRTVQDSLIPLGQAIMDIAEKIIPPLIAVVTVLADWFSQLNGGVQMGIVVFGGILAAIGPVLVVLGTIVSAIAPLLPMLSKAWTLLSKLRTVFTVIRTAMLLLTGPVGIITAIVVALATLIYQNWDLIKEKTAAVFGWLGEFLPQLWEGLKIAGAAFMDFLVNAFKVGLEFIATLFSAIWEGIKTASAFIWDGIVLVVTTYIEVYKLIFTTALNFIANLFSAIWEGIKTATLFIFNLLVSGLTLAADLLKTGISLVFNFIKDAIILAITTAKNTAITVFNLLKDGVILAATFLKDTAVGIFNLLKTGITTAITFAKDTAVRIFNLLKDGIVSAATFLKDKAIGIFNLLKSGITTVVTTTKDTTVRIFNLLKDGIITAVNFVKDTAITIFNRLKDGIVLVVTTTKDTTLRIFNTMRDFIVNTVMAIRDKVISIFQRIREAVTTAAVGIKDAITDAFNKALEIVKGLGTKFYNAGKGLIEQIIKGIKSMIGNVTSEMTSLAGKMRDFLPFSPAKTGPLSDLDKLDFGGPVGDSIKKALPLVRAKMAHLLQMPKMQTPDAGLAVTAAAGGQGAGSVTHGDTVNHFNVHTRPGQDVDIRKLSQELFKLQKRDQKGAGRK